MKLIGICQLFMFHACLLHLLVCCSYGNNNSNNNNNAGSSSTDNDDKTVAEQHDLKDDWIDGMFELLRHNTQFQHSDKVLLNESSKKDYREELSNFIHQLDLDLKTLFGNELGSQISSSWVSDFYPVPPEPNSTDIYVDEYVKEVLAIQSDPDCTSSQGELDLASPDFSIERAVQLWQKCRFLVIRNAYSENMIQEFRQNATQLVYDVKDGHVNTAGTTTYKETYYIHEVESRRWDMLLPKQMARDPYLLSHPTVMDIIRDNRVLGEDITCMAYGMFMAEPTAKGQMWHTDTPGIFGDWTMMEEIGYAGHHVPSAALTMFVPLHDMSPELGPTQFCVGAHALNGLTMISIKPPEEGGWLMLKDPQLREDLLNLMKLKGVDEDDINKGFYNNFILEVCPPGMWYSPILNLGDIAFWDYSTVHRSGPNNSKDIFRSVAYVSYARNGVKDSAFDGYRKGEMTFDESKFITGKFAKPAYGYNSTMENDKYKVEYYDDDEEEDIMNNADTPDSSTTTTSISDQVFNEHKNDQECSSSPGVGQLSCSLKTKGETTTNKVRKNKNVQFDGLPRIGRFLN